MALEQREKRLLIVAAGLVGVLAFYNYVHEPLFARRAEAYTQSETTQTELRKEQKRLAAHGNVKALNEAVTAREQVVDSWVPGKNSAAMFIWYLSQAEIQSGVRIKELLVGDRKQVAARPQADSAAAQSAPAAKEGAEQSAGGAPMLTVVQLELKTDARFAQHLLFSQALEETPLFLSTDNLELERVGDTQSAIDEVGKLVKQGHTWLAAQMLNASPDLDGRYVIDLYFKADKAGPATAPMQFGESTGKTDPFAMDGVDEFLQALVQYYKLQGEAEGQGREGSDCKCNGSGSGQTPALPGNPVEQMG
jgi:hypothetical protein